VRRLLTITLLAALSPAGAGTAAASTPPVLRPLHATRGASPAIVDDRGRQVLLRGVNVNQLGDYFQAQPALEPTVPLTRRDFRDIAGLGMGVVRLLVHWSALEPTPGAFDAGYVARIRRAVSWAHDYGIRVVLDMHQDAWGRYIASPPGTTCPPPLSAAVGWDGAPQWATKTDGLTTCKASLRELSPAVQAAWTNFYLDSDGIQQHLVDTWARLAKVFASDPTVAGYDLLNEPNPGFTLGVSEALLLGSYYQRATRAIRSAEQGVRDGFSHIVFFEPGAEWSTAGVTLTPLPTLLDDPNTVFAPHLYAGSITADTSLGLNLIGVGTGFQLASTVTQLYRTTVWDGEWGWFGDPAKDAASIASYATEEDAHLWGGAWWDWRQACGDPHNIGALGGQPGSISPSLHRYACPQQKDLGIPESTRRTLARPYPRSAPGRLTRIASDPATRAFTITGSDADHTGSCLLDVWVPAGGSKKAPSVGGANASAIRTRRSAGGWRIHACVHGNYTLRTI
jgi:endoglycosylceramidase